MTQPIYIHWFETDLRLHDNPALYEASQQGLVLPLFIFDDVNPGPYQLGAASQAWLHDSLTALQTSLKGALHLFRGDPLTIFQSIVDTHQIDGVYWTTRYEPWRQARDRDIQQWFQSQGITTNQFNGSLLWEPETIQKSDGTPFKVFTPFYKKGCLGQPDPERPLPSVESTLSCIAPTSSESLADLSLQPSIRWDIPMMSHWTPGEIGARQCLDTFLSTGIQTYKNGRNVPSQSSVSRLSPHIHFGELSIRTVWHNARAMGDNPDVAHFCSELGWREFAHSLLHHNPDLPNQNLQAKFDAFPWINNTDHLLAWQRGQTGIPMVDAGMRERWETGYMHNRPRMIVGSFLVKNLLIDWRYGERWFWDCLVDADLANNSASWQWVAGCGADAAPYFRIFNPVTQGQKFDPDGTYIKRFIPELRDLPTPYLFSPWEAPASVLTQAGIVLGDTYPKPIVSLSESRQIALDAFASLKKAP